MNRGGSSWENLWGLHLNVATKVGRVLKVLHVCVLGRVVWDGPRVRHEILEALCMSLILSTFKTQSLTTMSSW